MMTPVVMMIIIPWLLCLDAYLPRSQLPLRHYHQPAPPDQLLRHVPAHDLLHPAPLWQVWLSIAIGVASVYAALWLAAKVFRVGLLKHGKPPNRATLWRWVRMA